MPETNIVFVVAVVANAFLISLVVVSAIEALRAANPRGQDSNTAAKYTTPQVAPFNFGWSREEPWRTRRHRHGRSSTIRAWLRTSEAAELTTDKLRVWGSAVTAVNAPP
jgi:hypothetical protein